MDGQRRPSSDPDQVSSFTEKVARQKKTDGQNFSAVSILATVVNLLFKVLLI